MGSARIYFIQPPRGEGAPKAFQKVSKKEKKQYFRRPVGKLQAAEDSFDS